mgnify:CR=1 FL=1
MYNRNVVVLITNSKNFYLQLRDNDKSIIIPVLDKTSIDLSYIFFAFKKLKGPKLKYVSSWPKNIFEGTSKSSASARF